MSTFKEMVASDIPTFLNADEFAETHELNGKKYTCIVQSPKEDAMFETQEIYSGFEGTHGQVIIIHIAKDDYGEVPAEGESFTVNGDYCLVDNVIDDMGILTMTLHKNH